MDWKLKYKFPKGECSPEKCKKIKTAYLKPGKKNRFKASIDYQKKSKSLVVYLSMAFGNPYGEPWELDLVSKHVDFLVKMGWCCNNVVVVSKNNFD